MEKEIFDKAVSQLTEIMEKEPDACLAVCMVIDHIHGTYSDKYAKGENMDLSLLVKSLPKVADKSKILITS